jgi:hypothetical protein
MLWISVIETLIVAELFKKSTAEFSLPCSQGPMTGPPIQTSQSNSLGIVAVVDAIYEYYTGHYAFSGEYIHDVSGLHLLPSSGHSLVVTIIFTDF